MNPIATENKAEIKTEQAQPVQSNTEITNESAPAIKSEENQANWRAFREQREAERKAKEEAERRHAEKAAEAEALKAALEASLNRPQRNYQNEDIEESEEQRIDKRVKAIIAERETQYEKERESRERQEAPAKILQAYPDFKQVVSVENCDYLDYHHPELTAPFKYMPEGYEKWQAMYKAIKKFVPNSNSKSDERKVEKNLNKPGSISSTGATQGTGAMPSARLDDAKKAQNWERMQRLLKGLN
jgi:hypothetical protein